MKTARWNTPQDYQNDEIQKQDEEGQKEGPEKEEARQEEALLIVVKIVVENCNCGWLW